MASALLCCGVLGAGAAHADGPDGAPRRDGAAQQQQGSAARKVDPRNDPRSLDSYEARAEEQRRQMQEAGRNAEMNRRMGRMTPDERRDLRRQINEVGQDLYALPPRR